MAMMRRRPRPGASLRVGMIPLAAIFLAVAATNTSRADVGFGLGFFQNNAYQDTNFLNSWSLQNSAAAAANRPQPLTAPRFQTRDEGIMDRYDLATRESMVNRVARNPGREMSTVGRRPSTTTALETPRAARPAAPSPTVAPTPEPRPTVLLGNFFDSNRQLIWPSPAPITGELGKKQAVADRAMLAVLKEYDLRGLAPLSNVTEARERLLEYGRPALDYVRSKSTPALADTFHVFLLSLYSNLGLAATVARSP